MHQGSQAYHVKIVHFEEIKVAALIHMGTEEALNTSINTFITWRKQNNLVPAISKTFNVVYSSSADEECHYALCAAIGSAVPEYENKIEPILIPSGRCAVVRHIGSDNTLGEIINYLYPVWLVQQGETLRDFPLFFERVHFYPEVQEHEMVTDIYLPII